MTLLPQPIAGASRSGHQAAWICPWFTALLVGRKRTVGEPRAATGQHAGFGERNRFGRVFSDSRHPFDAVDDRHSAPELGALV